LQVTWATNTISPAKGTFNVTGGKLFYTPNAGEYGRDYFLYTASDGRFEPYTPTIARVVPVNF
jgi:hypothetical protein